MSLLRRHLADRLGRVPCRAIGQLAAQQRRKTEQLAQQVTVKRLLAVRLRDRSREPCAAQRERVVLVLRGRHAVKQPGQHLTLAGQVAVHAAQRIDDAVILAAQDDVGVLAHQLTDQVLFTGHAHFVRRVQLDREHTLDRGLGDGGDLRALHMLAQQHAEHGRRGRVFACGINKVRPRRAGRNGQQQAARAALPARLQHDFIPVGLVDLFHAAARKRIVQFVGYCPKADCV